MRICRRYQRNACRNLANRRFRVRVMKRVTREGRQENRGSTLQAIGLKPKQTNMSIAVSFRGRCPHLRGHLIGRTKRGPGVVFDGQNVAQKCRVCRRAIRGSFPQAPGASGKRQEGLNRAGGSTHGRASLGLPIGSAGEAMARERPAKMGFPACPPLWWHYRGRIAHLCCLNNRVASQRR